MLYRFLKIQFRLTYLHISYVINLKHILKFQSFIFDTLISSKLKNLSLKYDKLVIGFEIYNSRFLTIINCK